MRTMMAKDYFEDITPPNSPSLGPPPKKGESFEEKQELPSSSETAGKSIRNIPVKQTRMRPRIGEDIREPDASFDHPRSGKNPYWLWGATALALIVLLGVALVALRPTTLSIVPRSQVVQFDQTARFIAYPAISAASGTLPFTLATETLEDSDVVEAQGTERAEDRASGTITVFNDFSATPVKLLKNTRFQSPDGHIFRAPGEVLVPGKEGATPGKVDITVFADMPGAGYNIAPARFVLPGFKGSPEYTKIYGISSKAMSGGFTGERPAVPQTALAAVRAKIHARLQEKARAAARAHASETTFAFPDLVNVTFESLPPSSEAVNNLRIRELAHVEIPLFPADQFADTVAESVSADAGPGAVQLLAGDSFSAHILSTTSSSIAEVPLQFALSGQALLVWKVDGQELASALAGRDKDAFQSIVKQFTSVEEAHARIEPFWKHSFPANADSIKIHLEEPKKIQ